MADYTYHFVMRKGPRPGRIFPLTLDSLSVGRDPMSDLVVNDPELSRHHARLTLTADGYQIQDMGSTNGTFVEGERLRGEPVLLQPGQSVALGGNVVFVYEVVAKEDVLATGIAPLEEVDSGLPPVAMPASPPPAPDIPPMPVIDMGPLAGPHEEPPGMPDLDAPGRTPAPTGQPALTQPPRLEGDAGTPEKGGGRNLRRYAILGVLLLLCCCCSFLISGYYYWGDLLLNYLQITP